MKLSRRIFLSLPLLLTVKPSWSAPTFPLPAGNFVPAKMPLNPVFPRPDSETSADARHRWAHPDFRYEIPIGVQGGAWPFKYEIIAGPTGATIGQYYGDVDYGVVKWAPSAGDSGTKTFTVRVTDQELNTVDLTWTTTIDANKFIFIQDGYTGTEVGTIDQPLNSFASMYKGSDTDATYAGKIAVFRAGTYGLIGTAPNTTVYTNENKPGSWIGFPGEVAILDFSQSEYITVSQSDRFYGNLTLANARADANRSWYIAGAIQDRVIFWNLVFDGLVSAGGSNHSAIHAGGGTGNGHYWLIKHCTFQNFINPNFTSGADIANFPPAYVNMYKLADMLIEENKSRNTYTENGYFLKATTAFVTLRANEMWDNVGGRLINLGYDWTGGEIPHDHEICWNQIVDDPEHTDFAVQVITGYGFHDTNYNTWFYRNTLVGTRHRFRFFDNEPVNFDGNVVISTRFGTSDEYGEVNQINGIPSLLVGSRDIVSQDGKLSGQNRQDWLGVIGHEISVSPRTKPKGISRLTIG